MIAITPAGWYDWNNKSILADTPSMKELAPVLARARDAGIGLIGMKEEVIRFEGISRFYQVGTVTVKALIEVSLSIYRNEFVALMGPSGSGKSTMMNVMGCLDTPTDGSYFLNGNDVSKKSDNELAEETDSTCSAALGPRSR